MNEEDELTGRRPSTRRNLHGVLLTVLDVLVAFTVIGSLWAPSLVAAPSTLLALVGAVLAGVVGFGVVLRWRFPELAPVVVIAATIAGNLLALCIDPLLAAAWVIYPLAIERGFRRGWLRIGLFLLVIALVVLASWSGEQSPFFFAVFSLAVVACSWTLGSAVGERAEVAAHAAAERAELIATQHRLDVAREVHDVVAHTLGTIGVEAAVAGHVSGATEQELRGSLSDIAGVSRDALAQVKGLLLELRTGESARSSAPAPSLSELAVIVERARSAGSDATISVSGIESLDEVEQLTVFRIVQEAVTNVLRHAPGASCRIRIAPVGQWLAVEVIDDGPGVAEGDVGGYGLIGIQERVAFASGTCVIGGRAEGGFRVYAELPYLTADHRERRRRSDHADI